MTISPSTLFVHIRPTPLQAITTGAPPPAGVRAALGKPAIEFAELAPAAVADAGKALGRHDGPPRPARDLLQPCREIDRGAVWKKSAGCRRRYCP